MFYRKLIAAALLVLFSRAIRAQEANTFAAADSISWGLYQSGKWTELLKEGNSLIGKGTDFPNLRLRIAYAAFMLGNYSEAQKQYKAVLKDDSFNQTARFYAQLCAAYLNHPLIADYHRAFLINQKDSLPAIALKSLALESGIKTASSLYRKNGYYNRVGAGIRVGWKTMLEQSISYFGQHLYFDSQIPNYIPNQQVEYSGKLSHALSENWSLWAAYHYLNTSFNNAKYQSNIGLGGIKFSRNYFDVQADANLGTLSGNSFEQYNGTFSIYPFGNLNLYGISRASYHSENSLIFSQLAGVKLSRKFWIEASVVSGKLNNFIEADGLYVYNSIDPSTSKFGSSILYSLSNKSLLQLNYTREQKQNSIQTENFNQHSITAAISWKF